MRVLLAHKFHHLTGGAEVFYFEVARILEDNGHEVAFFSTEDENNIKREQNIERFIDPPKYDDDSIFTKVTQIPRSIYSFRVKQEFTRLIEDFKPDIIHVFAIHVHLTPSILVAAKQCGVPVVMSCNDYKHICPNYKIYHHGRLCEDCFDGKFYKAIENKCCKDSTAFSAVSALEAYVHNAIGIYDKYVARYLFASSFMLAKTKEFWEKKQVSYGIVQNPFNANQYTPKYEGNYVLYFGRIIDEKGVDRLIYTAEKLSQIPFKIVGDGPDLLKLENYCIRNNIKNVEFCGPKWGDDLTQILVAARFVVVPSIWHENFPYVIFQAFAAGKPVIGSNRGGIPELIGSDRGVVFDIDSEEDLQEKLSSFWSDEFLVKSSGIRARNYVEEQFSDEKVYQSLMKNYQEVCL